VEPHPARQPSQAPTLNQDPSTQRRLTIPACQPGRREYPCYIVCIFVPKPITVLAAVLPPRVVVGCSVAKIRETA